MGHSQEAVSSCAFELCGCVLSTSTLLTRKVPWTVCTWLVAGGSVLGWGDMQVVPCALKNMPAHSESAAVIQTCTGSLHLSQGP